MWGKELRQTNAGFPGGSTPRMWGKNMVLCNKIAEGVQPPRMWGKENRLSLHSTDNRFNPTHVGKSWVSANSKMCLTVQPHVCGEKRDVSGMSQADGGSTPRMWEKTKDLWPFR